MSSKKSQVLEYSCICQFEPIHPKDLKKHLLTNTEHEIKPIFSRKIKSENNDNLLENLKAISESKLGLFFVLKKTSIQLILKNFAIRNNISNFLNNIHKSSLIDLKQTLRNAQQSSESKLIIQSSKQKIRTCINNYPIIELSPFRYKKKSIKLGFKSFLDSHISRIVVSKLSNDEKILIIDKFE